MQAVRLFEQGFAQAEVARRCGVSHQSAARWHLAWRTGGSAALKHPGRAGRKARLQPQERRQLVDDLQLGPRVSRGLPSTRWTLSAVVELIDNHFGHRYSQAQASRLLRQMGWVRQGSAGYVQQRETAAQP